MHALDTMNTIKVFSEWITLTEPSEPILYIKLLLKPTLSNSAFANFIITGMYKLIDIINYLFS